MPGVRGFPWKRSPEGYTEPTEWTVMVEPVSGYDMLRITFTPDFKIWLMGNGTWTTKDPIS